MVSIYNFRSKNVLLSSLFQNIYVVGFVYVYVIGSITVEELATVIRSLDQNSTDEELQEMMNDVDAGNNGAIEFKEFLNALSKRMEVI